MKLQIGKTELTKIKTEKKEKEIIVSYDISYNI